ncbi:MAG TPA: DUF4199 domain-containing protein [Cyclobacteriaceae bacterium]|nr:DUF4199 domain-containing protein [Cyclobacteriaceae bacterium]
MEQQEEEKTPTLVNHALKWGIISAAAGIVITAILYAVDYTMLASFKALGVLIVVGLGIVIYAGIEYRKLIGGYLPFGQAWQHAFVVFVISGVISVIFQLLLYNIIDTELPEKMADAIVENTRSMMENFGAPADQIDTQLEKVKTDSLARFTMLGMIKGFGFQLIFYAVFALIIALITRKNPPVEQM